MRTLAQRKRQQEEDPTVYTTESNKRVVLKQKESELQRLSVELGSELPGRGLEQLRQLGQHSPPCNVLQVPSFCWGGLQ